MYILSSSVVVVHKFVVQCMQIICSCAVVFAQLLISKITRSLTRLKKSNNWGSFVHRISIESNCFMVLQSVVYFYLRMSPNKQLLIEINCKAQFI